MDDLAAVRLLKTIIKGVDRRMTRIVLSQSNSAVAMESSARLTL